MQAPQRLAIPCLVPDLPDTAAITPWLERIERNRWYTNFGPIAGAFEARLSRLFTHRAGAEVHLSCTSSGTTALEVALAASNLPPGSRVLVPSFTFPATATAVLRAGHVPVFGDVCPKRWQLTPEIAMRTLESTELDAIMPVCTFGVRQPARAWHGLSRYTGLPVILDAAAALETQEILGSVIVCMSLHATKPFGIGEGGLVAASRPEVIERCRRLINFGFEADRRVHHIGFNGKLPEIAAAVGMAQLERWPGLQGRRRVVFERYLRQLPIGPGRVELQAMEHGAPPPAVLVVKTPMDATALGPYLAAEGIETRRWYAPPLHEHPAFSSCLRAGPDGTDELPVATRLGQQLIGLPFHTHLEDAAIDAVSHHISRALEEGARRVA